MARETVPAGIVRAIEVFRQAACNATREPSRRNLDASGAARAALNATILHHLRGVDKMKAALERIEAGT